MDTDRGDIEALERFVVENDDLLALEELIGRFNIFDALGIERRELQHSNFLGWLLDPGESHGLGDLFLRPIMMDLLREAPPEMRPLSPIELDGARLSDVVIRREWQYIDLLIDSHSPDLLIAIENKVDTCEHSDQLSRYLRVLQRHWPQRKPLLVLLSPDGRDASCEGWLPYSYTRLHETLSRTRRLNSKSIGIDVTLFLEHYLSLIEAQFMDNPEVAAICSRIAQNHRRALELLWQHRRTPGSELIASIAAKLRDQPDRWVVTRARSSKVDFAPRAWPTLLPPVCGTPKPNEPWEWLVMTAYIFDNISLYLELYIGPTTNAALRERVLNAIEQDTQLGIRNRRKDKLRDNAWRVVFSRQVAKWTEEIDTDSVLSAFDREIGSFQGYIDRLTTVLTELSLTSD